MPTSWRPLCSAARACASANERPFADGSDSSTTVQPVLPAGHDFRAAAGVVVVFGGAGCVPVPVDGTVGGVTVGSGGVIVEGGPPAACGSPTGASPFPGGEALTAYSSQRSGFGLPSPAPTPACLITVASASRSPSPLAGASAAFPQLGQNPASAGSGWSHCVQVTTACSPTGRPQFAQKWEPQMIGAPQSQRLAVVRRPAAAAASIESSSCR